MVTERFIHGARPVYERAAERGRMLPDGLRYLDSWIVDDGEYTTCFQLMETDDAALFEPWIDNWRDLGAFEVHPVIDSAEVRARLGI